MNRQDFTMIYEANYRRVYNYFSYGIDNKKLMYVKSKLRERGYDGDLDAIEAAVMALKLEEPWVIEAESEVTFDELKPPDGASEQE